MERELTFLDKLGWGLGIWDNVHNIRLILKGQYILKTRAAQEEKNDTQHLEFLKEAWYVTKADFYRPITMNERERYNRPIKYEAN